MSNWIKGTPDEKKDFITTYWIWDGEYIILARWITLKKIWEVRGHQFDPEKITHYQPLIKPEPPVALRDRRQDD